MRGTTVEEMNRLEIVAAEDRINRRKCIQQGDYDDDDFDTVDVDAAGVNCQRDANEDYNSADTEEMITQMKKPQVSVAANVVIALQSL